MTFKERLIATSLGILSFGIPAEFINHQTYNISPSSVLIGIMFASIIGYSFGVWRTGQEEDNTPAEK